MSDMQFPIDSLVLYKTRAAQVVSQGDKLEIRVQGGDSKKVRPKDLTLIHPGPLKSLSELSPRTGEVQEALELLEGEPTTLTDLAELIYGENSPANAWAAWQLVQDGLFFEGNPQKVLPRSAKAIAATQAERQAQAEREAQRQALLKRIQSAAILPEDHKELAEVERVALGQQSKSPLMREIGRSETVEGAHALLLKLGYWLPTDNPYPRRARLQLVRPELSIGELPDERRVDLTGLASFAIDDEGNQDPDDAVALDGDRLWVHVADVAALVTPDSELDRDARARGSSLYLPEITVPMLPESLTHRLGQGLTEISPALSFGIRFDTEGNIVDTEIVPSLVRVTRLSYAQADERLDQSPLRELYELTQRYRQRRKHQGAAVIDLPESKVSVSDGRVCVTPFARLKSRDLVTDAMLAAGEAAGRLAQEENLAFPYASQPAPDETADPDGMAAMFAYRKRFKRSQTKCAAEPHFGLGLEVYSRATSPLRRYADLLAHQQLRAWLAGELPLDEPELANRLAVADTAAGEATRTERLSNLHWKLVYLQQNPAWTGEAVVVEKKGQRLTVMIPELAMDARVSGSGDPPLDSVLQLAFADADLPQQIAHFKILG
ncbi:MAG: RNB domain-containing ribonuclease [Chromatiales bacterium]|nr:RNB domain-containing ribonuclease [Chromatiales bacterium]